jgi:hypothetical protein
MMLSAKLIKSILFTRLCTPYIGLLAAIAFLFDKMKEDKNKTQLELENAKKDAIDSIEKIRLASTYVELLHSRKWRAPFEQYRKEFYEGANELYKQIVPKVKNFVLLEN